MKKKVTRIVSLLVILFLTTYFVGCSSLKTTTKQYNSVDKLVSQEQFAKAATNFQKSQKEDFGKKDRVLFWIDAGLLDYYANNDSLAIKYLALADNAIEELYTKSVSKGAASMLLNDNALDYSGEDYENLYINVFEALSYYREGLADEAQVEIRRLSEKLAVLEDRYKQEISKLKKGGKLHSQIKEIPSKFYNSALANYISAIIYYNEGNFDDARISKEKLYDAFDNESELYDFPKPTLDTLLKPSGNSKIAFLAFIGKSPIKHQVDYNMDTNNNQIDISVKENGKSKEIFEIPWVGVPSGIHAKLAIPKLQRRGSVVNKIEVYVDGGYNTNLFKLESLENIEFETFKRRENITFMKSLARTVSKAILNEAANKELDKKTGGGIFGSLTRLVTGAIINSTENADLRISHYFPGFAYYGYVTISPGVHNMEIVYKDKFNKTIETKKLDNYYVPDNKKINLIETTFLN